MQPAWLCILSRRPFAGTLGKSQTSATSVTMYPLMHALWGHIWKHTMETNPIHATSETLHPCMQALWEHIWKHTVKKIPTKATNVTMQRLEQAIWEHIWKYSEGKSNKCKQCHFASANAGDLRTHLKTHSAEKSSKNNHKCILLYRQF